MDGLKVRSKPAEKASDAQQTVHMVESEELTATRMLYDYLCHETSMARSSDDQDEAEAFLFFENLVEDELICVPPDCKLKKLLKAHGWERSHFVKDVDLSQLRQELGNIYLSKCVSSKDHDTSANIISMFCPDLLSVLLSEHKVSDINKLQPCSRAFHGACMLVDISGFTNLAASLCRVVASGATYSRSSRTFSTSQKSQTIRDYLRHMSGMNGSNGLDQLRSTTNVFLGNLVQTVYAHGGDVIAFAGDALLCTFTDDFEVNEVAVPHCIRALHCSQELIFLSSGSHLSDLPLNLHIAMSYGELNFAIVGGYEHQWLYILNGACVPELSSCIDEAKISETVITKTLYDQMQAQAQGSPEAVCTAEPTTTGNMKLTLSSSAESLESSPDRGMEEKTPPKLYPARPTNRSSVSRPTRNHQSEGVRKSPSFEARKLERYIKASGRMSESPSLAESRSRGVGRSLSRENDDLQRYFAPPPVTSALCNGTVDMSELRHVTTMFLKLDSFRSTQHANPLSLQSFVLVVQMALHETGGFLRQFLVDDKGCVVIGMWGVPTFSHINNALSALACSVLIRTRIRSLDHCCSIGIATGLVYCSSIGSSVRRDYVGIGDKVNLAARLMGKAKGRVLLDIDSYSLCPEEVRGRLLPAEAMRLKGIVQPYTPFAYESEEVPVLEEDISHVYEALSFIRSDIVILIQQQLDHLSSNFTRTYTKSAISKSLRKKLDVIREEAKSKSSQEPRSKSMYDPVTKKEKVGLRSAESSSIISSRWSSRSMLNSAVRIISSRSTDSLATSTSKSASVNSKYLSKSSKNSDDVVSIPVRKFPHYIVIEGMEGLSLSKIAEAYKEQVLQRKRKIVAFFEVGMEEDKGKNFGVMARLLVSIIKHQCHTSFGDESEQRRVLMHLLSDSYPLASKGEIEHYISFFQDVLMLEWNSGTDDDNITYGVDREVEDEEDSEEAAGSLSRDQLLLSMERSPLVEVFMHLAHELCCAVVIENAHYCDELSWQLLDQLFRMNPPHLVFFITLYPLSDQGLSRNSVITSSSIHEVSEMTHSASTRNSIGTMAYQSIVFNHRSQLISLSSLREEDVELLICKILNITSISSQLLQIICDVSLANPIWVTEIGLFIKSSGADQFLEKIKSSKDQNPLGALITFRFDTLQPLLQTVIKYASAIGDKFTSDLLGAIIPHHYELHAAGSSREEGLACLLEQLVRKGFIHSVATAAATASNKDVNTFVFQHELVRDTIYSQWPPSQAEVVHHAIALHIETTEKNLQYFYPKLCYHYKMSNAHHSAAYKYTVKAADHFISISSYKEGLMYARSAYEMASTRTELRELLVVTRAALSDIKPTMTRRLKGTAFSKKAQSRNKYLAGFQQLKSQIKQKIEEYAEVGPMYSNSLRRPSTPLLWEAPYAHMNSNHAHNKSSDIQCILC